MSFLINLQYLCKEDLFNSLYDLFNYWILRKYKCKCCFLICQSTLILADFLHGDGSQQISLLYVFPVSLNQVHFITSSVRTTKKKNEKITFDMKKKKEATNEDKIKPIKKRNAIGFLLCSQNIAIIQ